MELLIPLMLIGLSASNLSLALSQTSPQREYSDGVAESKARRGIVTSDFGIEVTNCYNKDLDYINELVQEAYLQGFNKSSITYEELMELNNEEVD